MTRVRRTVAAGALALGASLGVVALMVPSARAQAPDVVAWWNAANVGNGSPPPPTPPDVASGDLLVQGSNAAPAPPVAGVTGAPISSQAVAGLLFDLPDGAQVGNLTLAIDGTPPPSVTIVACKATQVFAAEDNGVWTDVPPSDCSATVPATVDGTNLVFTDMSKLVTGSRLAIVLLPGSVDRVVLKKPADDALAVTTLGGFGSSAAPFGTGTNAGPQPSGGGVAQPVAPVGGSAVLPPSDSTASTSASAAPPVVATGSNAAAATAPVAKSEAAGSGGLTTSQRRALAAVIIGLEMLGFLLLRGDEGVEAVALGGAAAGAGAGLVGGRLRPPDRGRDSVAAASAVAGIGRFRVARQGRAPRL